MNTTLLKQTISMGEALNVSITGIVVVMIILALLAVIVVLLSKAIRAVESKAKKKSKNEIQKTAVTPAVNKAVTKNESKKEIKGQALPETQSAGSLDLYKTDEKTAAVIMAIVSNESGIPLNRLQFNSIKLIEE